MVTYFCVGNKSVTHPAGFSFTGAEAGYARDDVAVGHSLHAALTQFFTMFPELKDNHFYATGISHGGELLS